MMKKLKSLAFYLVLSCLLSACVETIDFQLPVGFDESIVVQGKLSVAEVNSIDVHISQLFNNDAKTDFFHINEVLLQDDLNNEIEVDFIGTQIYRTELDDDFPIDYNRKYRILLALRNGQNIESEFVSIKDLPKENSLSFNVDNRIVLSEFGEEIERPYVQYFLDTRLSNDKRTKYHHDIRRTYKFTDYSRPKPLLDNFLSIPPLDFKRHVCYITDKRDVNDIRLFDPLLLSNVISSDFRYESLIYEEPLDHKYAEGYYFTVIQESLDSSAFEYYDKITRVLGFTGGMFEPKPALVKSNMKFLEDTESKVYGFFYATTQDTTRIYVDIDAVGRPDTICLSPGAGFSSGEILSPQTSCRWKIYACCDCLNEEASSLEKPAFWTE